MGLRKRKLLQCSLLKIQNTIKAVFIASIMLLFSCVNYQEIALEKAKSVANNYYHLISENKILDACLYIDEQLGDTSNHSEKCTDGTALIYSRMENAGSYISHKETGGSMGISAVEDHSHSDAAVFMSVTYENARLTERFYSNAGKNSDATLTSVCFDPVDGEVPFDCW